MEHSAQINGAAIVDWDSFHDEDTFTLVVISATQWKKNTPEVFSAFDDCSSFCIRERVRFDDQLQN